MPRPKPAVRRLTGRAALIRSVLRATSHRFRGLREALRHRFPRRPPKPYIHDPYVSPLPYPDELIPCPPRDIGQPHHSGAQPRPYTQDGRPGSKGNQW